MHPTQRTVQLRTAPTRLVRRRDGCCQHGGAVLREDDVNRSRAARPRSTRRRCTSRVGAVYRNRALDTEPK